MFNVERKSRRGKIAETRARAYKRGCIYDLSRIDLAGSAARICERRVDARRIAAEGSLGKYQVSGSPVCGFRATLRESPRFIFAISREKRTRLTRRRFHFPRRRVAGIFHLPPPFPPSPPMLFFSRSPVRESHRADVPARRSRKRKLERCVNRTRALKFLARGARYSLKTHKPLADFRMHIELY